MATSGGQPGNQNSAKGRPWRAAIERALAERSRKDQRDALDELAEQLLRNVSNGDITAIKELGDRLDGKPSQQVIHTGDADNPVAVRDLTMHIVDPGAPTD